MKSAFAAAIVAAAFVAGCAPPGPLTTEDKCAMLVANTANANVDSVVHTGTVDTAIGPKAYFSVGGANWACQADRNGNPVSAEFQS